MNICSPSVLTGNEGGNKKLYTPRTRIPVRTVVTAVDRGPASNVFVFGFTASMKTKRMPEFTISIKTRRTPGSVFISFCGYRKYNTRDEYVSLIENAFFFIEKRILSLTNLRSIIINDLFTLSYCSNACRMWRSTVSRSLFEFRSKSFTRKPRYECSLVTRRTKNNAIIFEK